MGLVLQGIWAGILVLLRTRLVDSATGAVSYGNLYSVLLDYVIFAALMFYVLTIGGIFVLRRKRPDAERPYRAWGYPVVPVLVHHYGPSDHVDSDSVPDAGYLAGPGDRAHRCACVLGMVAAACGGRVIGFMKLAGFAIREGWLQRGSENPGSEDRATAMSRITQIAVARLFRGGDFRSRSRIMLRLISDRAARHYPKDKRRLWQTNCSRRSRTRRCLKNFAAKIGCTACSVPCSSRAWAWERSSVRAFSC